MTPRFGRPAADTWRDAYELAQRDFLKAQAELSRIRTLLSDRDRISALLEQAAFSDWIPNGKNRWLALADKLKAYLLGEEE